MIFNQHYFFTAVFAVKCVALSISFQAVCVDKTMCVCGGTIQTQRSEQRNTENPVAKVKTCRLLYAHSEGAFRFNFGTIQATSS